MKVVLAQGNPEKRFDGSRHNLAFRIIDECAAHYGASWKEKTKFRAFVAELTIDDQKVILVKPTTFYNDTGMSAAALADYYKIDTSTDLLVIHDDLSLPFGTIRIRSKGSDAGNNGIKSINSHIGPDYRRLRVGIWNELRDRMDDVSFVLGNFSKNESDSLTHISTQSLTYINQFVSGTLADETFSLDTATTP